MKRCKKNLHVFQKYKWWRNNVNNLGIKHKMCLLCVLFFKCKPQCHFKQSQMGSLLWLVTAFTMCEKRECEETEVRLSPWAHVSLTAPTGSILIKAVLWVFEGIDQRTNVICFSFISKSKMLHSHSVCWADTESEVVTLLILPSCYRVTY